MFPSFLTFVMLESLRSSIPMVPIQSVAFVKKNWRFWSMYYYTLEYPRAFQFSCNNFAEIRSSSFVWRQIQLNSHHDFSSSVLFDNDHDIDQNWGAAFMENEKYFGKNVGEEIFHFLKANVWLFMTSGEYRSVLICVAWPIVDWSPKDKHNNSLSAAQ